MPAKEGRRTSGKILHAPQDQAMLDRFMAQGKNARQATPSRIATNPESVERDLARLVLSVIDLLRQLLERQAVRRVESGALCDEEIERLGQTLLKLETRMGELKAAFGLGNEELALDLGPLRQLLADAE